MDLQRSSPPGLAVGGPHRRRHQGGGKQHHPAQRDQRYQPTHRLQRDAGISAPVDWTKLHTGVTWPSCDAYVQVQKAKFVPVFGHGKQILRMCGQEPEVPGSGCATGGHAGHVIRRRLIGPCGDDGRSPRGELCPVRSSPDAVAPEGHRSRHRPGFSTYRSVTEPHSRCEPAQPVKGVPLRPQLKS